MRFSYYLDAYRSNFHKFGKEIPKRILYEIIEYLVFVLNICGSYRLPVAGCQGSTSGNWYLVTGNIAFCFFLIPAVFC